jgi:Ni,Fe-hydrogenase I cytochrome b subunit
MGTMADHHADHQTGEHKHGSMDIRAQEKTFEGFIRMSIWVAGISIAILIFMGLVNA